MILLVISGAARQRPGSSSALLDVIKTGAVAPACSVAPDLHPSHLPWAWLGSLVAFSSTTRPPPHHHHHHIREIKYSRKKPFHSSRVKLRTG